MKVIREKLDAIKPRFEEGGDLKKFAPVYEAVDTTFFSPGEVTTGSVHVRDSINHKRVMSIFMLALLPCVLMALWNTGYQMRLAQDQTPQFWINIVLGLGRLLPIFITSLIVQAIWVTVFAVMRQRPIDAGFLMTATLFTLVLPATMPLWQVALGVSFGVVMGREIFGGIGRYFINPVLTGWAFLFLAYPSQITGEKVWVAVDGYSGATPLSVATNKGTAALADLGYSWQDAFVGSIPGSMGETSLLAIALGAVILLVTGVASWRIMAAITIGVVALSAFLCAIQPNAINPAWHFALGGLAFGTVFLATDHSSAAITPAGQWIYGLLIGLLMVTVRVFNPAMAESTALVILFGNVVAPAIDKFVLKSHIKRRKLRNV